MKKINDRIVLGAVAGLVASQFGKIVMGQIHKKSHDYRFRAGASLFLPHEEVKASTVDSRIISSIVNNVVSGVSGVIITYVYSFTGKDFALVKGAGIGVLQWIGMYGLLSKLRVTIKSNDPVVHIISAIDHTLFGVLTGWLITKLGDDSLFPDKKLQEGKCLVSMPNASDAPSLGQDTVATSPAAGRSTASMAFPQNDSLDGTQKIKPIRTIKLTRSSSQIPGK